jgi:hypothetical protein
MKQLLEKLSELKDGYTQLSKANPDPVTAQTVVDQIFAEAIDLLERPVIVANLDNFLTHSSNPTFRSTARDHLRGNRATFVKGETELTRPMLKPSEIEKIVDTFLRRDSDGELIRNSTELRERLVTMHRFYCEGIEATRDLSRKSKKEAKSRLSSGVTKMVYGAGMLSANTFPFISVPESSASIVSCLAGISTFAEGLEQLQR